MAEIQANALSRYLIVTTSDIFLAKKVIKIRHSPTAKAVRKKNETFFVTFFKSLRFHMSTLKTKRYQNDSSISPTFNTLRTAFGRFSVDDKQRRARRSPLGCKSRILVSVMLFMKKNPLFLAVKSIF